MALDKYLEEGMFRSRWIMAPFYVGLVLTLVILLAKFTQELVLFAPTVLQISEAKVILGVLTLIDLVLAGNLLLMVIFAGYENFVSKIDTGDSEDRPDWMGKVDFSGLKLKLIGSIVAISGIHLLKAFMDIKQISKEDLFWLVLIHMAFVISGVLFAVMDYLTARSHAVMLQAEAAHEAALAQAAAVKAAVVKE
jgi:uncharacterized protein (TIGR00645 family)